MYAGAVTPPEQTQTPTPARRTAEEIARTVQLSNGADWLAGSSVVPYTDPARAERARQILAQIPGPLGEKYRTRK